MKTKVIQKNNKAIIPITEEELQIPGFKIGDEVELSKENGQVILRSVDEAKRKRFFEKAKTEIFEEWNDVFVELAKGVDEENDYTPRAETSSKCELKKSENGKFKFALVARNGRIIFESSTFDSKEEAKNAIDLLRKDINKINGGVSHFPVTTELATS